MNITSLLQSFGLSETESKVYLAALEKEYTTATEIAKRTGMKRPSVYHTLQGLVSKGLVVTAGTKVEKFKAQPADQLVLMLERKKNEIEHLKDQIEKSLPLFPTPSAHAGHSPYLEYFFGLESLKNLMEKIFSSKSKVIYTIGVPFKLMESVENTYILNFLNKRARAGIENYSIWHDTPNDKRIADIQQSGWHVRLAPKNIRGKNSVMITIVDDKVIFLNFLPELFGFLVTSQDFSDSMKTMWDALWQESVTDLG